MRDTPTHRCGGATQLCESYRDVFVVVQRDPLDVWDALAHCRDLFSAQLRRSLAADAAVGSPDAQVRLRARRAGCVTRSSQDVLQLLAVSQIKMMTAACEAATLQCAFSTAAAWIKESVDKASAIGWVALLSAGCLLWRTGCVLSGAPCRWLNLQRRHGILPLAERIGVTMIPAMFCARR